MLSRLLCFFGVHSFYETVTGNPSIGITSWRRCFHCGKHQKWMGFSNYTDGWVDV